MKIKHVSTRTCSCEVYPFCEHAPNAVQTPKAEAKYTPGPWTCRVTTSSAYTSERKIHASYVLTATPSGITEAEADANARLIAATPELFSLLDRMAYFLEQGETIHIEPGSVKAAEILAAIAKAEGRS